MDHSLVVSSSPLRMWQVGHKEGWAPKNWCFRTVVVEKTLESPLDCMEIKPVNSKGNQPWIFIGRNNAEAPILWPPDGEESTHWERPWCWERLRAVGSGSRGRDGQMASLTPWTWILANSEREWRTESLVCCSPWRHKELDTTERMTQGSSRHLMH